MFKPNQKDLFFTKERFVNYKKTILYQLQFICKVLIQFEVDGQTVLNYMYLATPTENSFLPSEEGFAKN